jgi:hypothetical protein
MRVIEVFTGEFWVYVGLHRNVLIKYSSEAAVGDGNRGDSPYHVKMNKLVGA